MQALRSPLRSGFLLFAILLAINSPGARAALPNGVAAGDTTQTSTVLWARSDAVGDLTFELATDMDFTDIVFSETYFVDQTMVDGLVPVKTEVAGLIPNTQYHYRAMDGDAATASGIVRTFAPVGVRQGARFGVSGDWRGELAPYASIANAVDRDLDFFIALGDTIYGDFPSPALGSNAMTEDEYRLKHEEVYRDHGGLNALGDLRGATSIFATIDDHEVANDFAGGAPASTDPIRFMSGAAYINDDPRYEAGLKAFHQYNPIRDEVYHSSDMRFDGEYKLYRFRSLGSDAAFFLLDARSFRDTEVGDLSVPANIPDLWDPSRTMLGLDQLEELENDLIQAEVEGITWKFILVPEPIQQFGMTFVQDRFEGYFFERNELLRFIDENDLKNVVFVAADIHGTLVNNLLYTNNGLPQGQGGMTIESGAWEISTGAVAFDEPFGQTVIDVLCAMGALDAAQCLLISGLSLELQNAALVNFFNDDFGPDPIYGDLEPIGIEAGSGIEASLQNGSSWGAAFWYGWTEFEIDAHTQDLTVTTYSIDPYPVGTAVGDILARIPQVRQVFTVTAIPTPEPGASLLGWAALGALSILARSRRVRPR